VVYTPAHTFIGCGRHFSLDLNHDGFNDFTIKNTYRRNSTYTRCRLEIGPDGGGGIAYNANNGYLANVFQKGQTIDFGNPPPRGEEIMGEVFALYRQGHYTYGYWINVKDGCLGLAFRIDGQIHFGWARLDVRTTGLRIRTLLTGYAYETQPNTPIIAGDTGGKSDADEEGQTEAQTEPMSETPPVLGARPAASLGALSLGAPGLAIWRRRGF